MTVEKMMELFEEYSETDFLKFNLVENKRSHRCDLHAFLLLEVLVPPHEGAYHMIGGAEHDEIWLDVNIEKLADVALPFHIRELVRCGVRLSSEHEMLSMFV